MSWVKEAPGADGTEILSQVHFPTLPTWGGSLSPPLSPGTESHVRIAHGSGEAKGQVGEETANPCPAPHDLE